MGKKWLPLESNPDVLNDFTSSLGLDLSKYSFHDIYGLDEVLPYYTCSVMLHCILALAQAAVAVVRHLYFTGSSRYGAQARRRSNTALSYHKGVGGC